ncbi:MAG: glycosyltransferase [Acidobacteria bacterium]|nr:glycosyltransferase [Acidobacteriota bacterium]
MLPVSSRLRALKLALHPWHSLRAALAHTANRPVVQVARRTWMRLWFEEHPLGDLQRPERRLRVRLAGRERDAIVVDAPASFTWRTRSQPHGHLDLWCAVMPGDWREGVTAQVTLRVVGDDQATISATLAPGASWTHRRWTRLRVPVAGAAEVNLDVRAGDQRVQVAFADAAVRWRRPGVEVRVLARAFASRLIRGGVRDTARWAQQAARKDDDRDRYAKWCARHTPDARALAAMARGLASWPNHARFSILTPVYNTDPVWLEACIESVRAQVYPEWELILSDDGSSREETRRVLRTYESDPRVRVVWHAENRGIAAATQAALERASGDFIAMLDHDDELLPHALYRLAARLAASPDADLIYSDEDKLELDGTRTDAYFKPDWSPDLFLSSMYVCHFLVMRRTLVAEVGGFRPGYDGSQDYDLVLRLIERTSRIEHVSDVLYHWRKIPESASSAGTAKPWAHLAGQRALQDYANRNALDATVEDAGVPGLYRMRYHVRATPRVSVIVATTPASGADEPPAHRRPGAAFVLPAWIGKQQPAWVEVILVVSPEDAEQARRRGRDRVRVVGASGSETDRLNAGADVATGDYLLFLSPGVEPRHDDWVEALLEHAQRPEVGAVGAKLFRPDGRLHHIGLTIGPTGVGRRSFDGYPGSWAGYFSNANAIRNCLAVSREAVMLSRAVFARVGGWHSEVADPDIAMGRRLREAGFRVVFTPYARFTAHPDKSWPAPNDVSAREVAPQELDRDPYYNLHFEAESADYVVSHDPTGGE